MKTWDTMDARERDAVVAEKVMEWGFEVKLMTIAPVPWECSFENETKFHSAKASTAPEAICLAALRAIGVEV